MVRTFMKVIGSVLVLLGLIGFIFPMQGLLSLAILHNIVHLLTGGIALAVSRSEGASRSNAKIFGIVYLLVGVLGLFTMNVFGLLMLMPSDTVIHFAVGLGAVWIS